MLPYPQGHPELEDTVPAPTLVQGCYNPHGVERLQDVLQNPGFWTSV